jgi:hypothetical protein
MSPFTDSKGGASRAYLVINYSSVWPVSGARVIESVCVRSQLPSRSRDEKFGWSCHDRSQTIIGKY